MPRRTIPQPPSPVIGRMEVVHHRFGNGLDLLVLPKSSAPIVHCDLHYRAGSVDDPPGRSGMAHLVEHLMFQGTPRFPKGQIDLLTYLAGGGTNAETGEDYTHYWFSLPNDDWTLALEIEADRAREIRFVASEFERERRVILEERARELDSAAGRLEETHLAMSYAHHPYRNPIFGWIDDLRAIDVGEAQAWAQSHLHPSAALLIVIGDVRPDAVIDATARTLGSLPVARSAATRVPIYEPTQAGRRAFVVEDGEGLPQFILGWHTVAREHPDGPVLDVLADLLAGGTRARLKQRLVDRRGLATWVQSSQEGGQLAGQFFVRLEAPPGADPAVVEHEIVAELHALAREGPEPEALARCRKRLQAAWCWEQQDAANLSTSLGSVALWQPWTAWIAEHRAALAVTPADIQRVIKTYLDESRLTIGCTVSRKGRRVFVVSEAVEPHRVEVMGERPISSVASLPTWPLHEGPPGQVGFQLNRTTLSNGLRVLMERQPGSGVVACELHCDGGVLREEKPGLAYLTARLREEIRLPGSRGRLIEALEDGGGHAEFLSTGCSIRAGAGNLQDVVRLIAGAIAAPRFEPATLRFVKERIREEFRGDLVDGLYRAGQAFLRRIYANHPLGRDQRGTLAGLERISLADVRAHQRKWFVPNHAFLVITGEFDPGAFMALLERALAGWEAGSSNFPGLPRVVRAPAPRRLWLARQSEQVHLLIGHLGIARRDPDYDALVILDHIFGSGPGFVDRLSRVLRDQHGLVYSTGGGMTDTADLVPGVLRVYASTSPENAAAARSMLLDQLAQMHAGQFGDEEVLAAQRFLSRSHLFDFRSVATRAEQLLLMERWGFATDDIAEWPRRILRVSPDTVRAAARRHLHPDRLVEVVAGPTKL